MGHKLTRILGLALLLATPPAAAEQSIGLLLPLSGANAELGSRLYLAAEQAFFDFSRDDDLRLVPLDTKSTAAGAVEALAAADKPSIIVGPIYAASLKAVVKGLRELPPILSLTADTRLADGGRGRYVLGVSITDEIKPPIAYACARGIRRFALLTADNSYGRLAAAAASEAVGECGGMVIRHVSYPLPLSASMAGEIAAEMSRGFVIIEMKGEAEFSAPIVAERPFAAVIMPAAASEPNDLILLTSMLPYTDRPLLQIIGGRVWNDPAFRIEPFTLGGWFSAPMRNPDDSFLAAAAYDAMALAIGSCAEGCGDRGYLTAPQGFSGRSGLFRLLENGGSQRRLAIFQITASGGRSLADPPRSFGNGQ